MVSRDAGDTVPRPAAPGGPPGAARPGRRVPMPTGAILELLPSPLHNLLASWLMEQRRAWSPAVWEPGAGRRRAERRPKIAIAAREPLGPDHRPMVRVLPVEPI